jgi:hypothetical protein
MIPPEVILDRHVKENFPKGYSGKLDIAQVKSPSFRTFLEGLQIETNDALRSENANASGGVVHPPFHFDYLDASSTNAHAIRLAEYWFIVLTLPLVVSVTDVSKALGRSQFVWQLLGLDVDAMQHPDILWGYLGQIKLLFLTSHEYTHLIHRHSARREPNEMWTEFLPQDAHGSIESQVEELDADGYAAYLVLAFLLRSERRERALIQLGRQNLAKRDADELIMSCFFLSLMAFFRTRWAETIKLPVSELTHPPVPVRIDYVIQVAKMWCGQFAVLEESWFTSPRLQHLFHAAGLSDDRSRTTAWDGQVAFLKSTEGEHYRNLLFEKANIMRRGRASTL